MVLFLLICAYRSQGWIITLNAVFLIRVDVSAKRKVIKEHFYIACSILYDTRKTARFFRVSTIFGVRETFPTYAIA